jgi:hypothetical protein
MGYGSMVLDTLERDGYMTLLLLLSHMITAGCSSYGPQQHGAGHPGAAECCQQAV